MVPTSLLHAGRQARPAFLKKMQAVTGTPAFKKVVDDVPNFATGGATIVVGQIE